MGAGVLAGQSAGGNGGFGADAPAGVGGLAGQSGASNGSFGDEAGASGAGPTIVPPGSGVSCGEATCEDSERCCIEGSAALCTASHCSGGALLECDDAMDCPGVCCYSDALESAYMATGCDSDCRSYGIEVCKEAGDCTNGDPCHVYRCTTRTATESVTVGLCTATPPARCE